MPAPIWSQAFRARSYLQIIWFNSRWENEGAFPHTPKDIVYRDGGPRVQATSLLFSVTEAQPSAAVQSNYGSKKYLQRWFLWACKPKWISPVWHLSLKSTLWFAKYPALKYRDLIQSRRFKTGCRFKQETLEMFQAKGSSLKAGPPGVTKREGMKSPLKETVGSEVFSENKNFFI